VRVVFFALLLSLAGCIHNWALERQCHKIRIGMAFADAYRTVTAATPDCSFYTPGRLNERVLACLKHRPDVPAFVSWSSPVVGAESPDQCFMSLDATGHVALVQYGSGD
jgi:hypothetical protein